jgi:hypothetical protein
MPTRLNGHTNLAILDRAITQLRADRVMRLIGAQGRAAVLNDLRVGLVGPVS